MSYEEGQAIRQKWADGATAELLGFRAAEHEPSPRMMSQDPYIQQRYDQGFHDGKAMLLTEEVTA